MASTFFSSLTTVLIIFVITIHSTTTTTAVDPDIITDFVVPANVTGEVDGSLFTFTGLRAIVGADTPAVFTVNKLSMAEFPALNGQSVGCAVLRFPAGAANPPHVHPRSAELLVLLDGSLQVGFVDTANKLYSQTLGPGDAFVFPKGLLHFQYNSDASNTALAISSFGSANAGTVSMPNSLFVSGIDDHVLALSFKTDVATIQKLKAGLAPKP